MRNFLPGTYHEQTITMEWGCLPGSFSQRNQWLPFPDVQVAHKTWVHTGFHHLFYSFRLVFLPIGLFIQTMMENESSPKKNESSWCC